MKHRYATCCGLLFTLSLAAQNNAHPALPLHPEGKHQGVPYTVKGVPGTAKALTYYAEDFDAGMNGWTVNTPVGSVEWALTSTGPGPTSSTYPVPPMNTSTPVGWMIVDDDYLGTSGLSTETWLVSPVIDLSTAPPYLKLEFDQYFQEWQAEHCFVGVSTDGGANWNEVEINEGVGRDGRPNPELVDLDISAWVVGNPANVQLRFKYVSVWDYGWQVDNIVITDLPANDMAILSHHKTDFDFNVTGLANIDYSIYPLEQLRPMLQHGKVKNKGYLAQTNATFNVSIDGPGGNVFSGSSSAVNPVPTQVDSLVVAGFTPPATPGHYTIDYTVTQDESDDLPNNNDASDAFDISPCIWAQDNGFMTQTQEQGPDHATEQFEVGNFFDVVNPGSQLHGLQVVLEEGTVPGALIYGIVYDAALAFVDQTDDYEVQPWDLNPLGDASALAIPMNTPLDLVEGEAYCVMVGSYGGAEQVVFGTSGISVPQVSILRYPNTDENFYVTKTPMVRAVLASGCVVGIEEADHGDLMVHAWPNPFDAEMNLAFELDRPAAANIELRDLSGRVVMTRDLGRLPSGRQQFSLDGSGLSAGTYLYTLVLDGMRHSGTLVRSGR